MNYLNFKASCGIKFQYKDGDLIIDATHLTKGVWLYAQRNLDEEFTDEWKFLQANTKHVIIKGNITEMPYPVFKNFEKMTCLCLPDSLESMFFDFDGCINLHNIVLPAKTKISCPSGNYFHSIDVVDGNLYYTSENGCLMSKDGKKLIVSPGGLDELIVPEGCEEIGQESIYMSYKKIVIPASVHSIHKWNFPEDYETVVLGNYEKQYELVKNCFTRNDSLKEEYMMRFKNINIIDIATPSSVVARPVRDASFHRDLDELKKREFGAIMRNRNKDNGLGEYGFITSKNLIEATDLGKPVIIKDIEDRKTTDLVFDYDPSGKQLAEYSTIEDMLDDGWRLD